MEMYLDMSKGRKSIERVDGDITDKDTKRKKMKEDMMQLGLENFEQDLIETRTVRKSEETLEELNKSKKSRPSVCGACGTPREWKEDGKSCPKCGHDHIVYKGDEMPAHPLTIDKSLDLNINLPDIGEVLEKAGYAHIPKGAERFAYAPTTEKGVIYIPVNRLEQVYQTDKATDSDKVASIMSAMKKCKPLEPICIGYNYDVQDGHHRWEAAMALGHTHVPCQVVGTDVEKVKEAKSMYREVWKSIDIFDIAKAFDEVIKSTVIKCADDDEALDNYSVILEAVSNPVMNDLLLRAITSQDVSYSGVRESLQKSLEMPVESVNTPPEKSDLRNLILRNLTDEHEAILSYAEFLRNVSNERVRAIIAEIMYDEVDHYHNLAQLLKLVEGDRKAIDKNQLKNSLSLVIDITKGKLNRSKLIKVRTLVRGKDGKSFYRMQWVDPKQGIPENSTPVGKGESSYSHSPDGIKDMERAQHNKFPVVYHETKDLFNSLHNYTTDKQAYKEALTKYDNGEALPVIKIAPDGEILENPHLVDLARDLGISHVPVVVIGNPRLKKELEDKLKDKVEMLNEDGSEETLGTTSKVDTSSLSEAVIRDVEHFTTYIKKAYPKDYIMEQAKAQGVKWDSTTKAGAELPKNSSILWMRAHQAIIDHIKSGKDFNVANSKGEIKKRMEDDGKDSVHQYFLKLLDSFGGKKQELMEYAKGANITWKEKADPDMNWMYATMAIKKELAKGTMINGIRTRQKKAMEDANLIITQQIKDGVTATGDKYGKNNVMERAKALGIVFNEYTKKGERMTLQSKNSSILWMRAHEAIADYIARGNKFTMGDEEDTGLASEVGSYGGVKMSKHQALALDIAKRNTERVEPESKDWAIKSFMIDRGVTKDEANELYEKFMVNARNAKMSIYFDPFELLPNGSTLIDQITSDGTFKNDWDLKRGYDEDRRGSNENDMFTFDYYDTPESERPTYGAIDLFNQGGEAFSYGDVGLVLKKSVASRTTGSHVDADNISYGQEGKTVRSMEDPHHLLVDRWRSKWKQPNKKNVQRSKMMESVISGTPYMEDKSIFEVHVHGGIDLYKDIDHITVPSEWQNDKKHKEKLDKMTQFASLTGASIKYVER